MAYGIENCDEYIEDYHSNLRDLELRHFKDRIFLPTSECDRPAKIRWLRSTSRDLVGDMAVAFRAVDYLDRFSKGLYIIPRTEAWQGCVIAACLLIASKMETSEKFTNPSDLVFVSNCADLSVQDILDMEITILNTLKFEMETATAIQFLYLYMDRVKMDVAERIFASHMCEKSLGRPEFYEFYPSQVALSCIDLALEHTKSTSRDAHTSSLRSLFGAASSPSCLDRLRVLHANKKRKAGSESQ